MKYPTPTRRDHQRFCEVEGWTVVRDARGRRGTHHVTYELALPDGRILRTRISHPPDRTDIGAGLFSFVLRDQLDVTDAQFWACVRDGLPPPRSVPEPPGERIPPEVVRLLKDKVGYSDDDVRRLTRDQAIAALNEYWTNEK